MFKKEVYQKFDLRTTELLIRIYLLEKTDISYGKLAQLIEISQYNPNFAKVFNFLKLKNILERLNTIGRTTFYKLNYSLLKDVIDQQDLILMVENYKHASGHIVL